jgi:endonuclease G
LKKFIIAASLALASLSAFAACEDKFAYGEPAPKGDYTDLCRSGYATIHDNKHKIPFASFEHLDPKTIGHGNVQRKDNFREDPDVRPDARAHLSDYKAGAKTYDRGHMADAQNASDDKAMSDTFYLSNMVPQVSSFNRGMWKNLETHVAKMVRDGRELYVISGAMPGSSGTIGNGVNVPAKLFKVVIDKKNGDTIAYIIPNAVSNQSYKDFQVTLQKVEDLTGVDLIPGAFASEKLKLLKATGESLK